MKLSFNQLAVTGLFVAGISTASAAELIIPVMIDDFQDGLTNGCENGTRVLTKTPPVVVKEGDNYYLEVMP